MNLQARENRLVKFFGFDSYKSSSPSQLLRETVLGMGFVESADASLAIIREDPGSLLEALSSCARTDTRVLLAGELRGLDFDQFDYVIGWELGDYGDRYVRLHPANREFRTLSLHDRNTSLPPVAARSFCDFIYSNPNAHPFRDAFFYKLSAAKGVDSLGPHLFNGPGVIGGGQVGRWEADKIKMQSNYRFSLAIENATYSGYTTEKLLTPVVAGSIPIYWGNPDVGVDFNEARFINLHRFKDMDDAVQHILLIAEDLDFLEEVTHQPILTPSQVIEVDRNKLELRELIERAYQTSISSALRRPHGTSPWQREELMISSLKARKRVRMLRDILDFLWYQIQKIKKSHLFGRL